MSSRLFAPTRRRFSPDRRSLIIYAGVILLIVAMALSTKVVRIDSAANVATGAFSTATYGSSEFPKVQAAIEGRAVNASTLAVAIAKDPVAAGKKYGVPTGAGPEFSLKFTGVAGTADLGTYTVVVPGVPKSITIQIQTGPAIIGTDLRDAAGTITFGQFTNQIEYQNAGAALNTEMKKDVLSKIDAANLKGKTLSVVGAFSLTDPKIWLITPAKLAVR